MRKYIIAVLMLLVAGVLCAQKRKAKSVVKEELPDTFEIIAGYYADSLRQLRAYYDSAWTYKAGDQLRNPYYFPLFFKPTLYNNPLDQLMSNTWSGRYNTPRRMYSIGDTRDDELQRDSAINNTLAQFYVNYPQYIEQTQQQLMANDGLRREAENTAPIKHEVSLAEKIKPDAPIDVVEPVKLVSHRPNFWKYTAFFELHYNQTYSSENWRGGKNKYNSLVSRFYATANYNFNEKVIFNNSLELRLAFQTERSDTIHPIKPTQNELKINNMFGLKAIKNVYYSISLEHKTPVIPRYNSNSRVVNQDFFSPYEGSYGVGFTYNVRVLKKYPISFTANPINIYYKYMDRNALARYGKSGKRHHYEAYGSNLRLTWQWQLFKILNWRSEWTYGTNYTYVETEWRNTYNVSINKYIGTTLDLYMRFDDRKLDRRGRRRMQLSEIFSLGFSYNF